MKAFTVWDWIVTSSKSSQLPQTLVTYSGLGYLQNERRLVQRLFQPDLWWLGCTYPLSQESSYNPISYQLGSVWPMTILLLQLD